jgi:hypothetical protein
VRLVAGAHVQVGRDGLVTVAVRARVGEHDEIGAGDRLLAEQPVHQLDVADVEVGGRGRHGRGQCQAHSHVLAPPGTEGGMKTIAENVQPRPVARNMLGRPGSNRPCSRSVT